MSADETLDFEAAMARLDAIVQELESPQVGLDRAIALFEEGLALGNRCTTLLDQARARVEKLLERPDGTPETRPFDPADGA